MNQSLATVLGLTVICLMPLIFFAFGVYYARYGLPLVVRWRGFGHTPEDDI